MRIQHYQDPAGFCRRVMPLLMRQEALNNLMLGILTDVLSGVREMPKEPPLYCSIENDAGEVTAAALSLGMLVLTQAGAEELDLLIADLIANPHEFSIVSGPAETVRLFSRRWAQRTGKSAACGLRMRIMELASVMWCAGVSGTMRLGEEADIPLLTSWIAAFMDELKYRNPGDPREFAEKRVKDQRVFIWSDPELVSMACTAGPTPNGMRINYVYTPPEFRRRGYARACVTRLSERLLASGKKIVFLYVETDNAATNQMYRTIGYQTVGDWEDYHFSDASSK
jgi:predicted GNAT family acetyltransferase